MPIDPFMYNGIYSWFSFADTTVSVEDIVCSMVRQQEAHTRAAEMAAIVSGKF